MTISTLKCRQKCSYFQFESRRIVETQLIRWQRKGSSRHSVRTWMIRVGVVLIAVSGTYLALGVVGVLRFSPEVTAWNNIRIISGCVIFGCLLAAV